MMMKTLSFFPQQNQPNFSRLLVAGLGLAATAMAASAATGTGLSSSSVTVQETPSSYQIELSLPEQDARNLELRMEGTTLHMASGESAASRQEQSFLLPEARPGVAMNVKRDNGRVEITIPKADAPGTVAAAQTARPHQVVPPQHGRQQSFDTVRDQILSQFAQMQQQMGRMMSQADDAGGDPFDALFSGMMTGNNSSPGGFELREQKDKYILSAELPEEQAKNIKIAVDNDRILKITSEQASSQSNGGFGSQQSSQFTQAMSLPGPVKTDQVSMDYKDGRFEITLPKA